MAYPVSVSRKFCTHEVTIRIHLRRSSASCTLCPTPVTDAEIAALPAKWKKAIEKYWNGEDGAQVRKKCLVTFVAEVVAEEDKEGDADWHDITVHSGVSDSSQSTNGPGKAKGDWFVEDEDEIVAHECGHLLAGLPDEYEQADGATVNCNPDPPVTIMGASGPDVVVRDYHVEALMRELHCYDPNEFDTECPAGCPRGGWRKLWHFLLKIFGLSGPVQFPDICTEPYSTINYGVHESEEKPCIGEEEPEPPEEADAILEWMRGGGTRRPRIAIDALLRRRDEQPWITAVLSARNHPSGLVRWAVSVVLSESRDPRGTAVLLDLLRDSSASVRIRAAQGLLYRKRTEGIPVLIAELGNDEWKSGHPPRRAGAYANRVLRSYTGKRFGWDPGRLPSRNGPAIQAWQAWWDAEGDGFRL